MNKAVRITCGLTVFYLANPKKKKKKQKKPIKPNCIKYLMYGESVLPSQKHMTCKTFMLLRQNIMQNFISSLVETFKTKKCICQQCVIKGFFFPDNIFFFNVVIIINKSTFFMFTCKTLDIRIKKEKIILLNR